jgi:alpha-1,2-mannosyltransferase
MSEENPTNRTRIAILILLAIIFIIQTLFNEAWLFRNSTYVGYDFFIYYDAEQAAQIGESAYFPYEIGRSYLYPPATLSLLSLFSFIGKSKQAAMLLWVIANYLAYFFSIILTLNLLSEQSPPIRIGILILFMFFSPFVEMAHIGQINALVTLALVLTLHFSEKQQPLGAGISLALAIAMKITPFVFLAYFFVLRRYREIAFTLIALTAFHILAWLQFGPRVFEDFIVVLPRIGSESYIASWNHSFASTLGSVVPALAKSVSPDVLSWFQKGPIAVIGVAILSSLWFQQTKTLRCLAFGIVTVLMTTASPLLWHHHNVFLIYPLLLLLTHQDMRIFVLGAVTLTMLVMRQLALTNMGGIPTVLAHILLLTTLCVLYIKDYLPGIRDNGSAPAGENNMQAAPT